METDGKATDCYLFPLHLSTAGDSKNWPHPLVKFQPVRLVNFRPAPTFQIEDRRSFQRFIGLSDAKHTPDRNSYWLFRESLKELKLTETLLNEFNRQLDRAGMIARKGQLIDASFVKAPVQRNTPEENA